MGYWEADRAGVPVLTWTAGGAVERPKVVQIRVQRSYPGRVRAGAPVPTRSMSGDEVVENLRYFTAGGPRGVPVTGLVLSGVGVASRSDLGEIVAGARAAGIERITLHAGVEDLDGFQPALGVDLVTLPLQPSESGASIAAGVAALVACRSAGLATSSNTVLDAASLPMIVGVARAAVSAGARGHTFTFPFPVDGGAPGELPPAARAVAALLPAVAVLDLGGVPCVIKGLPACYLGELSTRIRRSANRWYVDADRQKQRALLFFPDVVAFTKEDGCRFCPMDGVCDGFFAAYLRRPGFPRLAWPETAPTGLQQSLGLFVQQQVYDPATQRKAGETTGS